VKAHVLPVRVYYEDTDAGGVVYHARYLGFAERARTEFLRSLGFDHGRLAEEEGILFAVAAVEIQFKAPARLDDLLEVRTRVVKLGGASMEMEQVVTRDDKVLSELKVTLVCIDQGFKAVRLPEEVRAVFTGL
jgi:acyl-CoA thioester hydrolase